MATEQAEASPPDLRAVNVRLDTDDLVRVEVIKAVMYHQMRGACRVTTSDAIRYALRICELVSQGQCPIEECPYVPTAQSRTAT